MYIFHQKSRLRKDRVNDLPLANSLKAVVGADATMTRASDASYVDRDGVLQFVGSNVARFERNGLLIEPAATNIVEDGSDLTAGTWVPQSSTVVASGLAPDGSANSYKITATDVDAGMFAICSGTSKCFSIWLKAGSVSSVVLLSSAFDGGAATLTNEWCRYYVSCPSAAVAYVIALSADGNSATIGDYIYAAFAQVEAGTFPTSYIATSGGSAARAKDVVDVSSAAFPAANADYTVSVEYDILGAIDSVTVPQAVWSLTGETYRYLLADLENTAGISANFICGAAVTDKVGDTVTTPSMKVVARMDSTGVAGTSVLSMFYSGLKDTQSGISGFPAGSKTSLAIGHQGGNNQLCGHIRRLVVYNRALTDRECKYA